jgi:hypothetical protein
MIHAFSSTNAIISSELPSLKRTYKRKRRGNVRDVSSDDSDEDETKLIEAQRRARRQARNIEVKCPTWNLNAMLTGFSNRTLPQAISGLVRFKALHCQPSTHSFTII